LNGNNFVERGYNMISMSSVTFSSSASPPGTVIGTLTSYFGTKPTASAVISVPGIFYLDPSAAGLFAVRGSSIITAETVPVGVYSLHVYASSYYMPLTGDGWFQITVTP